METLKNTLLETKNLELHYYEPKYLSILSSMFSNKDLMNYVFNGVLCQNEISQFIDSHFARINQVIGLGCLLKKSTHSLIGFAGIQSIYVDEEAQLEIGCVIDFPFQRQHFAQEIVKEQLDLIKKLGKEYAFATVHEKNNASINLLASLQMTKSNKKYTPEDRGPRLLYEINLNQI